MTAPNYDAATREWEELIPAEAVSLFSCDPDEVPLCFDMTGAMSWGKPVDPSEYPAGTFFYYGTTRVYVRLADSNKIIRQEHRYHTLEVSNAR